MDRSFPHVKVISIYLLMFTIRHVCTCLDFSGIGHTYPVGDIQIEYNTSTPLEIICVITNDTLITGTPNISTKLYFQKDKRNVSSDKIIRLNETSIKLVEEDLEKMSSFYSCMLEEGTICLNSVAVGTQPQNVTDFKCVGYNYENLTCSWTPPNNYVQTNYSLSYTFPKTRAGSRPTDCKITDDKDTGKKKCFWGYGTRPHYRQVQPEYNFTLKSENRFGSLKQVFLFDHLKNILSGPPENLSCINSTVSSLLLYWKVPTAVVPFPNGLEHRVLYQCKFGPKIWQFGKIIETKQKGDVEFNLTGLKHAHDVCDIRVAIRVMGADSEEMWSANASVTALTSSTIPDGPPRVNIGGFQTEVLSSVRDIYVYWQQIAMEMRNADSFGYVINVNDRPVEPGKMTNSYAKFSNMSLDVTYKFTITSKNSEGFSKHSTAVVVPSNDKMISEPVDFTKVSFENGQYKLSWEKPKRYAEYVENYTLFWCSNEKDRPFQCSGYLNWTEVPANVTEYNITVLEDHTTQFAISANNASSSSGMVWATCTVLHNTKITKIKEVFIIDVKATNIKLKWKLYCVDRRDIVGYVIFYCPRGRDPVCNETKNITINDPYAESGLVTGLTPYTTYRLAVSMVNKQGSMSPQSDALYNTTYEGVPTEPLDVNATDVSNSTITIVWKEPKYKNGFLKYYTVYYNSSHLLTPTNETSFTLERLQSDALYDISVTACTMNCSNKSRSILVSTKVGRPGKIGRVWSEPVNNTIVAFWWKPEEKRRTNLYQLLVKYKTSNDENVTLPEIDTTENSYTLARCAEDGKYSGYYVTVRAVNLDNGTRYLGPWSTEYKGFCEQTEGSSLMWIIIVVGCIASVCVLLFSGKRLYVHLDEMKNIPVKMPEGLDPQIDSNWIQPKQPPSANDEERLLHKTFVARSGDSSGCSSGQESVSSDSGSSITSTSDSGTEQPRTPPIEEEPKTSPVCVQFDALKPTTIIAAAAAAAATATENQAYVQIPERMMPGNMNFVVDSNGYSMYGMPNTIINDKLVFDISSVNGTSDSGTEQSRTPPTEEEPKTSPLCMQFDGLKPTVMAGAAAASAAAENQPYVQIPERMLPWNVNSVNSNGYSMYGMSNDVLNDKLVFDMPAVSFVKNP